MAMQVNGTKIHAAAELISEKGFAGMAEAVQILMNEAMLIERERHLQAASYERTEERTGYANGFKPKRLKTRLGALDLLVPQVREGDFYPSFLERGIRSERALKISLAEMYIQGVSTRKVTEVLQELCGLEVSSAEVSRATKSLDEQLGQWRSRSLGKFVYLYLDARYEKVRHGGHVIDSAVLIAYGVSESGKRHVLGVSVSLSEAETHWRKFLENLISRGLHGLSCIVSDAHSGLKAALKAVFPSIPWQRCQFHLQQNAQAYVPRQDMKKEVAEVIRGVFNAPNMEEAKRLLSLAISKYATIAPDLSAWMEENITEGLTIFHFCSSHRRRLRTSNIAERVNKEIKRRTRVVTIFPSAESCERLVSAILAETSDDWESGKIYLSMDE